MKKTIILFFVSVSIFSISSCKNKMIRGCTDPNSISYDKDADEDDGSCRYGGQGGVTTLVVRPKHNGVFVSGMIGYPDSAFLKFNSSQAPDSAGAYDLIQPGTEGDYHVQFDSLLPGRYFVYMTGWDSIANARVKGGVTFLLTQSSGTLQIDVPVSQ